MKKTAALFWTVLGLIVVTFGMGIYTGVQESNEREQFIKKDEIPVPSDQ